MTPGKEPDPEGGRLAVLLGHAQPDPGSDPPRTWSVHQALCELLRISPENGCLRLCEALPVLLADITDSASLLKSLGEDFGWLMLEFYAAIRAPILKHNGVLVNFLGDGVLAAFPGRSDLPGDTIKRHAPPREARAILSALELAREFEHLVEPGGKLHIRRQKAGKKDHIPVELKVTLTSDATMLGALGLRRRSAKTRLPLDLVALGMGPTFCHEMSKVRYGDVLSRHYLKSLQAIDTDEGARRFVREFGPHGRRWIQSTTIAVHAKVRDQAVTCKDVTDRCELMQIPKPVPIRFGGELKYHEVYLVLDKT